MGMGQGGLMDRLSAIARILAEHMFQAERTSNDCTSLEQALSFRS
jgi:hypothetical protein